MSTKGLRSTDGWHFTLEKSWGDVSQAERESRRTHVPTLLLRLGREEQGAHGIRVERNEVSTTESLVQEVILRSLTPQSLPPVICLFHGCPRACSLFCAN